MAEITSQPQYNERYVKVPYMVLTALSSEVSHSGLLVVLLYIKCESIILEISIRHITFYP